MPASSSDVEFVELQNGFAALFDLGLQRAPLTRTQGTTNRSVESRLNPLATSAQIQRVAVKCQRRQNRAVERPSPDLKMFPVSLLPLLQKFFVYEFTRTILKQEWPAYIGEWKAYASAPGQRTPHFHHGNERHQLTVPHKAKIERYVTVGVGKHLRPGTAMKERGIRMRRDLAVPLGVAKRIDDACVDRRSRSQDGVSHSGGIGRPGSICKGFHFDARAVPATTSRSVSAVIFTCAGVSSGNIGSEMNSLAQHSATGNDPFP